MNAQQIEDLFRQTLEDRRMSRGERNALSQIMDQLDPSEQTLTVFRNVAFKLAAEHVDSTNDRDVVEWLEEAAKLLQTASGANQPPSMAEAHFSPTGDCQGRISGLLRSARQSVDICVFTITDDRISSAILEAHKRRVKVRIISDDDKSQDLGSDIERLADAGVPVRIDNSRFHMHHKFAIFDNKTLLTGSFNWTRSAAENNEENFILTDDQRLLQPFARLFNQLWDNFS